MGTLVVIFIVVFLLAALGKKPSARKRERRPAFKERYDLNRRQQISEFEPKLAHAMFIEVKEVFVTAFCTDEEVLCVTATIGTTNRCRASDRVERWGAKAKKTGATQVRQYHNHPHMLGRSIPSRQDRRSNQYLRNCVEPWGVSLRTFLIYKPWLGGYAIKEYR